MRATRKGMARAGSASWKAGEAPGRPIPIGPPFRKTLISRGFPAAHGCAAIFDASKALKMKAFGNRVFERRADFGQDGQ